MSSDEFVPVGFDPPTSLATDQFRLEPLGPQHNQADHAAWMSSIEHIRSTPGYPHGNWPPRSGMTLEENLTDLRCHAEDFARGAGLRGGQRAAPHGRTHARLKTENLVARACDVAEDSDTCPLLDPEGGCDNAYRPDVYLH
jgi:hypothetical protein